MRIIKPSFEILTQNLNEYLPSLKLIERAGRTCYKSEENINEDSAQGTYALFSNTIGSYNSAQGYAALYANTTGYNNSAISFVGARLHEDHHESIIEHSSLTVKFICDRGVSHELVRHRLVSFSQESTRYCNYSKGKHGNQLTFIQPLWISDETLKIMEEECDGDIFKELEDGNIDFASMEWFGSMGDAEQAYLHLLELGWKPEQARSVLPNSLKTEIVVTANFREWRLIFKQCTSEKAHPQMRELMIPLLEEVRSKIPVIFDNL